MIQVQYFKQNNGRWGTIFIISLDNLLTFAFLF